MSRKRGAIRHTNPIVCQVLEAVERSGMLDKQIVSLAGVNGNEIAAWRRDERNPTLMRMSKVLAVVGAELVVQERQS